ncbi:DUF2726 domain-containing protein [Roseibaca sp. Y0-43]|uniref:DUF2726 domain-containing protein n=1 Tax=Roseibaca sp. Y0-43 TaxID=2816854 RepID=UPI001D0CAD17|nr:DUF2726 domain-containing protein [Roseibaca sp. Y0-43]MCC1480722.1 DUF2726 domain-containing protein [Roseibaca sp. Y0-43]
MKWIDTQTADIPGSDLFGLLWAEYWFILPILVFSLVATPLFRKRRYRRSFGNKVSHSGNLHDPAEQLRAITSAKFQRKRLMNQTEFTVFRAVESVLPFGYRLMAQTSLGEVLGATKTSDPIADRRAHASINSKRLDIAVIDRAGFVALAIEVQGAGHYGKHTTFIRDAVKREALRRAGIPMLEVYPDWNDARIQAEVSRHLSPRSELRSA